MGQYTAPLRVTCNLSCMNCSTWKPRSRTCRSMPTSTRIPFNQVLEEAGKFCGEVLFPLIPDWRSRRLTRNEGDGVVRTPDGVHRKPTSNTWKQAGRHWVCDPEYGGQGLPAFVNNDAVRNALKFGEPSLERLYPACAHGAYECVHSGMAAPEVLQRKRTCR